VNELAGWCDSEVAVLETDDEGNVFCKKAARSGRSVRTHMPALHSKVIIT